MERRLAEVGTRVRGLVRTLSVDLMIGLNVDGKYADRIDYNISTQHC